MSSDQNDRGKEIVEACNNNIVQALWRHALASSKVLATNYIVAVALRILFFGWRSSSREREREIRYDRLMSGRSLATRIVEFNNHHMWGKQETESSTCAYATGALAGNFMRSEGC
jgi:hypothetical protein